MTARDVYLTRSKQKAEKDCCTFHPQVFKLLPIGYITDYLIGQNKKWFWI